MEQLITLLREKQLTIGAAESITGGLFASELVNIPHASEVFLGSIVSYANSVKEDVLTVDKDVIYEYGAISEHVVKQMAHGAQTLLKSDITVSFSGNAGPLALEDKPVGAIYTCIFMNNKYNVYYDILKGNRYSIRYEIVQLTVQRVITLINEKGD